MMRFSRVIVPAVAALLLTSPVSAQLLGGGGPVGGVVGSVGNTMGQVGNTVGNTMGVLGGPGSGPLGGATGPFSNGLNGMGLNGGPSLDSVSVPSGLISASPADIENYREARLRALIEANRGVLDRDDNGQPVRKRELIATNPDAGSLAIAARSGFQVIGDELEAQLGIRLVTLAIPRGMNVRQALKAIRQAAPATQVDFNHIYEPSGGALLPVAGAALAVSPAVPGRTRIAMIDGGIASHPALANASIEQRGFAGDAQPTGHGTAVGSLLVGEQGPFRGAARGAQLFVGDVYGGNPAAGSVTSIVRALSWAASKNPSVINISLVGPNNAALARAIGALRGRGIQIVAAVGNDGPAAPPQYPASYPGVVSVTGVDAQGRALREAGRAAHLDFAAPGADMIAAFPGKGYTTVRGTSFAAPLAAARLALTGSYQRLAQEAQPGEGKVGHGIVCGACRVDPRVIRRK
jgi:hypothetical protein